MDELLTKRSGIVTFISEDGVFGTIICDEDEMAYDFHKFSLAEDIEVGTSVVFTGFYDSQSMKYIALGISKKELVRTLEK